MKVLNNLLKSEGFDDKYALIDKSGNLLTPFKYDVVSDFEDGVAFVEINNKIGLIDKNGKSTFDILEELSAFNKYNNDYIDCFKQAGIAQEKGDIRGAIDCLKKADEAES